MEYLQLFRFVYILGAVNAVFFAFLIFKKTRRTRADIVLGIWLLVLSIQLFFPFFYLIDESKMFRYAGYESMLMAYHPVFLFNYIILITGERGSVKRILKNFIPPILVTVIMLWGIGSMSYAEREQFFNSDIFRMPLKIWLVFIVALSCLEIYLMLCFIKLRRHKRKVLQLYSYRDNVDLFWLWKLLITFSIFYAFVMTLAIIFYFTGIPIYTGDFIFYGLLVVFIFFLGYWGWKQGIIFSYDNGFTEIVEEKVELSRVALTNINSEKTEEGRKLEELMEVKKLFLNQSLSLTDLTNEINIPPHQLSKVIHREFGVNFFEFVNRYRVDYFKQIANLPQYQHYTILAIAFECGFNSKASFNRIFKEYTGLTPGEVRNKL